MNNFDRRAGEQENKMRHEIKMDHNIKKPTVRYFPRPENYWEGQRFNMNKHVLLHDWIKEKYGCVTTSRQKADERSEDAGTSRNTLIRLGPSLVDILDPTVEVVPSSSSSATSEDYMQLAGAPVGDTTSRITSSSSSSGTTGTAQEFVPGPAASTTTRPSTFLQRVERAIPNLHTSTFLNRVEKQYFSDPLAAVKEFEVPCDETVWRNEMKDCAGTLAACEDALNSYFCAGDARTTIFGGDAPNDKEEKPMKPAIGFNIGGGSHHAAPFWGEGYCVLNDVAIALQILRSEGKLPHGAVVFDCDVHQGNGTSAFFPPCYRQKFAFHDHITGTAAPGGGNAVGNENLHGAKKMKMHNNNGHHLDGTSMTTSQGKKYKDGYVYSVLDHEDKTGVKYREVLSANNWANFSDGTTTSNENDFVIDHLYQRLEIAQVGVAPNEFLVAGSPHPTQQEEQQLQETKKAANKNSNDPSRTIGANMKVISLKPPVHKNPLLSQWMYDENLPVDVIDHPYVMTISLHENQNFPHWRPPSTVDVELRTSMQDEEYLKIVQNQLTELKHQIRTNTLFPWQIRKTATLLQQPLSTSQQNNGAGRSSSGDEPRGRPSLLVYVAGANPYERDTLGGLKITKQGLKKRDRLVFEFCREQKIPVAVVLAGGYAMDVKDVADIHFATFEVLYETFCGPAPPVSVMEK
ncbi:unnamed protein product [Amoebophrya sp. A120]|nr:unnamed protein product [Amoebophrya sp. A120]|eukprot:GSA120T00006944001.1